MKTNVKNGLFIMGFIPVDTAYISISDTHTKAAGVTFETGVDGLYPVLAETNSEGNVTALIIDVEESIKYGNGKLKQISVENILVQDDEVFTIKDVEKTLSNS